jgi:Zn-dependent protease with chaperone function
VSDRAALRRAEVALLLLGLTPALLVAVFLLDVAAHHGLALEPQLAFAAVSVVVIARAGTSLARQLRAQRRFLARLPVVCAAALDGHRVWVIPGLARHAFCMGLLRPQIYVSEGAFDAAEAELSAILAHEESHRARRDPLRRLLARMVADGLRPLPPFAALAEREAALADLVADAAAIRADGGRTALAAAMLHFEDVAPARVDRLLGTARAITIPALLVATAGLFLVVIAAALVTMLVSGWHPDVTLPAPLEPAVLVAVTAPACLAAARVTAGLRPG